MKVNIEFESTDAYGEVSVTNVFAVMEVRQFDYRLVYVEDLSGEGKMTKSTMLMSDRELRILRTGELDTDFIYGNAMVHHTTYKTPYGVLPVTLETENYKFRVGRKGDVVSEADSNLQDGEWNGVGLPDDFEIRAETGYKLIMAGQEPLAMRMKIRITGVA